MMAEQSLHLACAILAACVAQTIADDGDEVVEVNSDYVRLPAQAVLCVMAFPLFLCLCCLGTCAYGCFKNDYESLSEYKDSENEGLIDVMFEERQLGLVMKEGLITDVDASTAAKYNVRVKDRMWRIAGQKVSALKGKEIIGILMSIEKRPLTIQFLRPSQTNNKVRMGIIKQETKNLTVLTTGALKGIQPYMSMLDTNHDGKLSSAELRSLDSNHDGNVSRAELTSATVKPLNYMQLDGPPPLPPPTSGL